MRGRARHLAAALAALALWAGSAPGPTAPRPAAAQELVADLSRHLVPITTGFVGTDVLLFGATEGEGDVIVVVRGPARRTVVRRKDRVAGIWVNEAEMVFPEAPSFYAVASSRPLDGLLPEAPMVRHGIGLDHLTLVPAGAERADPATVARFRAALIRNKRRLGLYGEHPGRLTFLGKRLFRTSIYFPANVPTGTYTVGVFLVRDGRVVSAQTTPLLISKVGLGAEVFRFAHKHAALYGILAVLIALSAGWLAGAAFRRA